MLRLVETRARPADGDSSIRAKRPTLAILYEQPVAATGLLFVLAEHFAVVGSYSDIPHMMDAVPHTDPEILAIEIGASVTLDTIGNLLSSIPSTRLVLWVDHVSGEFVSHCLALGVSGILSKRAGVESHIECFSRVAQGEVWIDRRIELSLAVASRIHLTPRERQIMSLLTQGLANKEIAWRLGISPGTVKVYLAKLFEKVGVGDRLELALMALRNMAPDEGRADATPFDSPARWMPDSIVNMPQPQVA